MQLWIRSQNKKQLAEITGIILEDNEIRGFTNQKDYYELGKYKTVERALEVLDEIQNILKPKIIYTQKEPIETYELGVYQIKQDLDMKIQEMNTYVYEMPEE